MNDEWSPPTKTWL